MAARAYVADVCLHLDRGRNHRLCAPLTTAQGNVQQAKFRPGTGSETGLDFFQARYYGATFGRFTSPDPGHAGADLYNPQSWNGYAYVNNSPLASTDPSGMNSCENNTGCLAGIPGCKENLQACQAAGFVSDAYQGILGSFDLFRLQGIPVTTDVWTPPQATQADLSSAHNGNGYAPAATISYPGY